MASSLNILLCVLAASALWTSVGLPIAQRLFPAPLALPIAPVLGWAVHSAAALPIHMLLGMTRTAVAVQIGLSLALALVALIKGPRAALFTAVPRWAYAAALLLALGPAIAVFPKAVGDAIALAAPIFDHSKVAMIDEMARLGVPPGNPFFGGPGTPSRLSYYYLWHFGAAELAVVTGLSSWEADAGLSWFTAFASLCLMMGLAVWISGRVSAAAFVILLAATASMRPLLSLALGAESYAGLLQEATGFGSWLFQSSWAPQHVMSASCAVLSIMLIAQVERGRPLLLATLVLVATASFESSVWVGGITFAIAAAVASLVLLGRMTPGDRIGFLLRMAFVAACAAALASPFLYDQFVAAAMRGAGAPIALKPFPVLGEAFPDAVRQVLDLPAFWLVHLVVEFPAIYPAGVMALLWFVRRGALPQAQRPVTLALVSLAGASLLVAAFGVSTVGINNDLAWRAVLPAVTILIVFAAAGLSRWISASAPHWRALAICGILLGLPDGIRLIYGNAFPPTTASSSVLARTPAMWEAVRRHSSASERVANNPRFLQDLTPWPVNISWALLSNRRSCYAGLDLVVPFTPLKPEEREAIDAHFSHVFDGHATAPEVEQLASRYGCRLVVITAQDGAWDRDPLATSAYFRLVESDPARWRIYRAEDSTKRVLRSR